LTRLQFDLSKLGPEAWNGKSAHLIRDDNVLSVAILPKDNADALQMIDKSFAIVRRHEADPSQFVVAAKSGSGLLKQTPSIHQETVHGLREPE
jgi:hypothetical protein